MLSYLIGGAPEPLLLQGLGVALAHSRGVPNPNHEERRQKSQLCKIWKTKESALNLSRVDRLVRQNRKLKSLYCVETNKLFIGSIFSWSLIEGNDVPSGFSVVVGKVSLEITRS